MKKVLVAVCAAASFGLSACADTPATDAGTVTPGPAASADPSVPAQSSPAPSSTSAGEVAQALRFTATTVDGQTFDAATLAGKPAVLWFWAAWCPRCRADAGDVRDLAQQYSDRVGVVGVAGLGSGAAAMTDFAADHRLDAFPQLADDDGKVWQRFKVPSQHYYIVLDRTGTVVHSGPLTVAKLKEKVDGLL